MRKTNFQRVLRFHRTFGQPVGETPNTLLTVERENLRNGFIIEEFCELLEAQGYDPEAIQQIENAWIAAKGFKRVKEPDIVEIADALGDIEYFNHGTAVEYGIDLDRVFEEIDNSNLSKLDENGNVIYRSDGKVMKSSLYFKPNIKKILDEQLSLDEIE